MGNDPKDINTMGITKGMGEAENFLETDYDDFKLLKPIVFTNNPYNDGSEFKLWNI